MTTARPLACPHCGDVAYQHSQHDADLPGKLFMHVQCRGCGARGGCVFGSGDPSEWQEARDNWNRSTHAAPTSTSAATLELLDEARGWLDPARLWQSETRARASHETQQEYELAIAAATSHNERLSDLLKRIAEHLAATAANTHEGDRP
jgi:hypothetical protein